MRSNRAPRGPGRPPKAPQVAPRRPKTRPGRPKTRPTRPKTAQVGPKTAPRPPKTTPRRPKTPPRRPQDGPKSSRGHPKGPQDAPGPFPDAPRPPRTSKMASKSFQYRSCLLLFCHLPSTSAIRGGLAAGALAPLDPPPPLVYHGRLACSECGRSTSSPRDPRPCRQSCTVRGLFRLKIASKSDSKMRSNFRAVSEPSWGRF